MSLFCGSVLEKEQQFDEVPDIQQVYFLVGIYLVEYLKLQWM